MRLLFTLLLLGLLSFASGCAGEPTPPAAEQFFADAKKNLAAMDHEAALKNLDRAIKAAEAPPLTQQCTIIRTALLTAMAEGTKQMGDAYRDGARQSAAAGRVGQFGQMKSDYYGISRVRLMGAMEAVLAQRAKLGVQPMPLDLAFPDYSGQEPAAMIRARNGQWVEDATRYRTELEAIRNALARMFAAVAGAGSDVAKGKAVFDKGGVQIDPRVYLIELSNAFLRLSSIFDRRALDDPRYRRISLEVVQGNLDVLAKLLAEKPDKELEARAKKLKAECEKELKTLP